eukprot:2455012-Rhodomonas_salina.1
MSGTDIAYARRHCEGDAECLDHLPCVRAARLRDRSTALRVVSTLSYAISVSAWCGCEMVGGARERERELERELESEGGERRMRGPSPRMRAEGNGGRERAGSARFR